MSQKSDPKLSELKMYNQLLSSGHTTFKEAVSCACGWSTATYYRKVRSGDLSAAESKAVRTSFFEVLDMINRVAKKQGS